MQYTAEKIKAQQITLFHLGFYTGVIDGVWGPACIQAKRDFESRDEFQPGNPNGGLPFSDRDVLPKGLEYVAGRLIQPKGITEEQVKTILTASESRTAANKKAEPVVEPAPAFEPVKEPQPKPVTEPENAFAEPVPEVGELEAQEEEESETNDTEGTDRSSNSTYRNKRNHRR